MDPSHKDLLKLAEQTTAMRSALERVRNELAVATAAEESLVENLRALGVLSEAEDTRTTVDMPEISGLPRRRSRQREEAQVSLVKAAAVGAGLVVGIAIVVLLVVNLAVTRRSETAVVATTAPPAPSPTSRDDRQAVPPPPPSSAAASAPPASAPSAPDPEGSSATSLASAVVPKNTELGPASVPTTGLLTVICLPKCDAVTDNNVALGSNIVKLPVAVGPHKLVLSAPNGVKKTLTVHVAPGQTQEVRASMFEAAAPLVHDPRGADRGF